MDARLDQGLTNLPVEGQRVNILGFVGPVGPVTATRLCHFSVKAARKKNMKE